MNSVLLIFPLSLSSSPPHLAPSTTSSLSLSEYPLSHRECKCSCCGRKGFSDRREVKLFFPKLLNSLGFYFVLVLSLSPPTSARPLLLPYRLHPPPPLSSSCFLFLLQPQFSASLFDLDWELSDGSIRVWTKTAAEVVIQLIQVFPSSSSSPPEDFLGRQRVRRGGGGSGRGWQSWSEFPLLRPAHSR